MTLEWRGLWFLLLHFQIFVSDKRNHMCFFGASVGFAEGWGSGVLRGLGSGAENLCTASKVHCTMTMS